MSEGPALELALGPVEIIVNQLFFSGNSTLKTMYILKSTTIRKNSRDCGDFEERRGGLSDDDKDDDGCSKHS